MSTSRSGRSGVPKVDTLDAKMAREIPDFAAKLKAEKASGNFTSLMDFYEKYRPANPPIASAPGVAAPPGPADDSLVSALRSRAETAETALADARQRILLLETTASNDLTQARMRIAELESVEQRTSALSQQLAIVTGERDAALVKADASSQKMRLLEKFNGLRGMGRGVIHDLGDPRSPHLVQKWKKMKTASRAAAWKYYHDQVKPFLKGIYDFALATIEAEKQEQTAREAEWAETMKPMEPWLAFYGAGFSVPTALPRLASIEAGIRGEMANFLNAAAADYTDPPAVPSTFLEKV